MIEEKEYQEIITLLEKGTFAQIVGSTVGIGLGIIMNSIEAVLGGYIVILIVTMMMTIGIKRWKKRNGL